MTAGARRRHGLAVRSAHIVVTALIVGVGISQLILTFGDWHLRDAGAYWEAAERLRDGQPLYPALADSEASETYRYAPWFAWAWVPLTLLPREVANALWSALLVAASAAALWPFIAMRAWILVALFLPVLVGISAIGNVQPLIVAALVLGVERRSGPLWIGAAASLKVVPIILAVVYLGRGEPMRAALAVLVAGILVAPMLLYDLSAYPTGAGAAAFLIGWPVVYAVVIAGGMLLSLRLASSRHGWLAAATTACLALPRFFVYDITFLMTAIAHRTKHPDHGSARE